MVNMLLYISWNSKTSVKYPAESVNVQVNGDIGGATMIL